MLVYQRVIMYRYMGLSENRVYCQWNSHLIGISWSAKPLGKKGVHYFQTNPYNYSIFLTRWKALKMNHDAMRRTPIEMFVSHPDRDARIWHVSRRWCYHGRAPYNMQAIWQNLIHGGWGKLTNILGGFVTLYPIIIHYIWYTSIIYYHHYHYND